MCDLTKIKTRYVCYDFKNSYLKKKKHFVKVKTYGIYVKLSNLTHVINVIKISHLNMTD
jgi:hypothetical protein